MNPAKIKTGLGALLLGGSLLMNSCVEDMEHATFMRYPSFWKDDMQNARVTLAPFKNVSETFDAEREIRFNISKELDKKHVYHLLDENFGITNNIEAFIENKRIAGDTDYVIYGILNDFKIDETTQPVEIEGGTVERTTIHGYAKMTIEVYQVSDGMRLSSDIYDKQSHYENDNLTQRGIEQELANSRQLLMTELAAEISSMLVPAETEVAYHRGDYINISDKKGNYDTAKKFPKDGTVYAILTLPAEARHNAFLVDVVVKGTTNSLVSYDVTWENSYQNFVLEIPVADFYTTGQTAYEVRIRQDINIIDYRRFTVE